jgi:uncharacterized protein YbjT (DUF2867 family)
MPDTVFITGGTGYMGSRLIPLLQSRGFRVTALVRPGSEHKLPPGCRVVVGDALDGRTYQQHVPGHDAFVHLIGVPHPSPAKAREFVAIDLQSGLEAASVARASGIPHFVYLSVAQPAPVMQAYLEVRARCEETIRDLGLNATILRPWYVLGPGHRWPFALVPFYWLAERIPATRAGALRLGLVTFRQMVRALARAVEEPAAGVRVMGVPEIRTFSAAAGTSRAIKRIDVVSG